MALPSIPPLQPLDRRSDDLLPVIAADKSFPWTLLMYRQASLAVLSVVFAMSVSNSLLGKSTLLGYVLVDLVFGGFLLFVTQRRGRRAPRWLPFIEAAVLVGILAYDPALAGTLLLLALCQFSIGSALFGTWPATIATFGLLVAAPVVTEMRGHIFDRTTGLMLGVFVPVVGLINHRVQRNERSARRQYVDLLTGLDAVVWEGDPDTLMRTFVSPQSRDLLGLDPPALISRWAEYVHPDDREREEASRRAGVTNERDFVIDFRMIGGDGNSVFVRDTVRVERDSNGKALRMRGVLVDITRQQEAEATVRKQALYDNLTGLPNRSLFNDQMRIRLEDAKSTGDGLAVFILDLNGFKEVNAGTCPSLDGHIVHRDGRGETRCNGLGHPGR